MPYDDNTVQPNVLQAPDDEPKISKLAMLLSGFRPLGQLRVAGLNDGTAAPSNTTSIPGATLAPPTTAPAPAVARDPLSAPLPEPPKYVSPDTQRYRDLEAKYVLDKQPINPKDPSVKPTLLDQILGYGAAFAAGYGRDPNAGKKGAAIINRRYNTAEDQRLKRVGADEAALGQYGKEIDQGRQDFDTRYKAYEAVIRGRKEQREEVSADAKANKDQAAAAKTYARQGEDGKWYVPNLDDPGKEIEIAAPKWAAQQPKSYQEMVASWAQEKDPARKKSLETALQRIEANQRNLQPITPKPPDDFGRVVAAKVKENGGKPLSSDQMLDLHSEFSGRGNKDGMNAAQAREFRARLNTAGLDEKIKPMAELLSLLAMSTAPDAKQRAAQLESKLDDLLAKRQKIYDEVMTKADKNARSNSAPGTAAASPQPAGNQKVGPAGGKKVPVVQFGNNQTLDQNNPQHKALAQQYLGKAGGDKDRARALAQQDGWKF